MAILDLRLRDPSERNNLLASVSAIADCVKMFDCKFPTKLELLGNSVLAFWLDRLILPLFIVAATIFGVPISELSASSLDEPWGIDEA